MRRLLYALGLIFAVIIIAVTGFVGFAAYRGSALDVESKAYVDQVVVAVGKGWDQTEILRRASPDLLKHVSSEQIAASVQQLAKLGNLVHYDGAKGQATILFSTRDGSTVRAHYEASATFKNGPTRFRIDLSKHGEQWMIDGFFYDVNPITMAPVTKPI